MRSNALQAAPDTFAPLDPAIDAWAAAVAASGLYVVIEQSELTTVEVCNTAQYCDLNTLTDHLMARVESATFDAGDFPADHLQLTDRDRCTCACYSWLSFDMALRLRRRDAEAMLGGL